MQGLNHIVDSRILVIFPFTKLDVFLQYCTWESEGGWLVLKNKSIKLCFSVKENYKGISVLQGLSKVFTVCVSFWCGK